MGEVLFVGDAHLGHRLVAVEERGFATVQDHNDTVLHNVARRCDEHSTVHWMGDVALGGWRDQIRPIGEIPGRHFLWLGNHDRAFPRNSQAHTYVAPLMDVFDGVSLFGRLSWNGLGLLLAHMPYDGDHSERDRFEQWRPRDLGTVLVHAHTHGTYRISFSQRGTMQIHAGLDAWGLRPPTLFELMVEAGFALPPMEA